MEVFPEELWWNIFAFYSPNELTDLYIFRDPIVNKILDDNKFWYWYFRMRDLPIFNKCLSFVEWIYEFDHIDSVLYESKRVLKIPIIFYISSIQSVKTLIDFKNEK